jgi:hydrogenase expression/formation protein HypC
LAIPALIVSAKGLDAEVEVGGAARRISLWLLPEASVGDYVYVHAGFAVSKVDESEALESLRLLQELVEDHPDDLFYTASDLSRSEREQE